MMITKKQRLEMKKHARRNLKKHYVLLVMVCLISALIGTEFNASFDEMRMRNSNATTSSNIGETILSMPEDVLSGRDTAEKLVSGVAQTVDQQVENSNTEVSTFFADLPDNSTFGRTRGVFSEIVNDFAEGGFLLSLNSALRSVVHSSSVANALAISLSFALYILFRIFVRRPFMVIMRRIALEARVYEQIPTSRFFFLNQCRKWGHVAAALVRESIYTILWNLTVIGGAIKSYSYRMMPYILAENPNLSGKEAIALSRKMMDGHKWECFLLDMSFFGWYLLEVVTLGFSGILYSNAYITEFFAEYYVELRRQALEKKIPGAENLCDEFLFRKAEPETLRAAYADYLEMLEKPLPRRVGKRNKVEAFFSDWFGVCLSQSKEEQEYNKLLELEYRRKNGRAILAAQAYPGLLCPAPMEYRQAASAALNANRSYTLLNLTALFFGMSFAGWLWEGSLHLITDGEFINRGILHGPWIPVYGFGMILILVFLRRLRENPPLEFVSAMTLCGFVEYYTGLVLELTHNGERWWDYSGYFLNINGRVCAEGLLVFGLGGCMAVYLFAPLADNILQKLNKKALTAASLVLIALFLTDTVYSVKNPNQGAGVTSVTESSTTAASSSGS